MERVVKRENNFRFFRCYSVTLVTALLFVVPPAVRSAPAATCEDREITHLSATVKLSFIGRETLRREKTCAFKTEFTLSKGGTISNIVVQAEMPECSYLEAAISNSMQQTDYRPARASVQCNERITLSHRESR